MTYGSSTAETPPLQIADRTPDPGVAAATLLTGTLSGDPDKTRGDFTSQGDRRENRIRSVHTSMTGRKKGLIS
jgi:hypothetical protein